jgi:hypothetical protein
MPQPTTGVGSGTGPGLPARPGEVHPLLISPAWGLSQVNLVLPQFTGSGSELRRGEISKANSGDTLAPPTRWRDEPNAVRDYGTGSVFYKLLNLQLFFW